MLHCSRRECFIHPMMRERSALNRGRLSALVNKSATCSDLHELPQRTFRNRTDLWAMDWRTRWNRMLMARVLFPVRLYAS